MRTKITRRCSRALLLPLLGLTVLLGSCASNEPAAERTAKAQISNEFLASAEVMAVEPASRMITLRREDGSMFSLQAGPTVQNYDQVRAGDALNVRYAERLTATLLPPGSSMDIARAGVGVAGARPGEKPGVGAGMAISVRARIESIDLERSIVVFSLASGELIARRVQTDEGRGFVKKLEIGDIVQLDYAEVLAVGIEHASIPATRIEPGPARY